ncbi:MAG: hypothetical protein AAGJ83_13660, partial [Planctomycetota bacterium]
MSRSCFELLKRFFVVAVGTHVVALAISSGVPATADESPPDSAARDFAEDLDKIEKEVEALERQTDGGGEAV